MKSEEKTLRDEFAMSVIPEIIRGQTQNGYRGGENILEDHCNLAYKIADYMIRARNRDLTKKF